MNAVSTLYLFSSLYPITASNVIGALSICPGVRAFLSVPYILKMLAESADGLKMLQTMDLVSTGGAPLPEARKYLTPPLVAPMTDVINSGQRYGTARRQTGQPLGVQRVWM